MNDVIPSFRKLYNDEFVPIGYQLLNCHMIFDVKMENFRRKVMLVEGGQVIDPPSTITYMNVVSRETVNISLTLASLNYFPVKVAYIQNSYITAPVT